MNKYLVLYCAAQSAREQMAQSTPEQAKAGMDAWMAWAGRVSDGIVDLGSPLGDHATLMGEALGGNIGGFSILRAESLHAARRLLEGHPHLRMPGASIKVMEFLPLPGQSLPQSTA